MAAHFGEWDVEGPNGFIRRLTMSQLWTWIEFDRLHPFMQEREDMRAGNIAAAIYNVNIIDKHAKVSGRDFAFPSMDEIIEKELEEERLREEQENRTEDHAATWKAFVGRLLAGRKPVQTTIKG